MADLQKVMQGLECCRMNGKGCRQCPYNKDCDEMPDYGNAQLCSDAMELLNEQQETIVSLQSTINKLTKALAEKPEQKFFVDSDGKMTPLPIQPQWISVKDRLPETRHAVLVYTPHHKNIWAASMHEDGNWYIWSPGGKVLLDTDWHGPITHWMSLPEPPKEVKQVD